MRFKLITLVFIVFQYAFPTQLISQHLIDDFNATIRGYPITRSFEIASDGSVYLSGSISFVGQESVNGLFRLNGDLTLDESFDSVIGSNGRNVIHDISATSDGGVLIRQGFEVSILNKDGSLDEEFSLPSEIGSVYMATVIRDQYLLCARKDDAYKFVMINSDGSIDEDFEQNEILFSTVDLTVQIQSDDKLLISGVLYLNDESIAGLIRLNSDGTIDEDFDLGSSSDGHIRDVSVQSDGKIIIVGEFDEFKGTECPGGIVRLDSDGRVDDDFVLGSTSSEQTRGIYGVEVLSDDKIMLAARTYDSMDAEVLLKLNSDGTLDEDYTTVILTEYDFYGNLELTLTNEDELLMLGGFVEVMDSKRLGLALFSGDGTLLEDADLGGDPGIKALALQNDGKIVVAGEFHEVNGVESHGITRLNTDGSLDSAFNIDLDLSNPDDVTINALSVLEDGDILVGGEISTDELSSAGLFRINNDGSFDNTFEVNTTAGYRGISNIYVDDDGLITLAGDFSAGSEEGIAQFNSDGSVYESFESEVSIGSSMYINNAHFTSDGDIVVSGYDYNSSPQSGFSYRLDASGAIDDTYEIDDDLEYATLNSSIEIGDVQFLGGSGFGGGSIGRNIPILKTNLNGGDVNSASFSIAHSEGSANCIGFFELSEEEIIVYGRFEKFNGFSRKTVVRFNVNGEVDEHFSFDLAGSTNDIIKIDEEYILVGGTYGIEKIKLTNEAPVISVPEDTIEGFEEESVDLSEILTVLDSDNNFPDDFEFSISEGENYTVSGSIIIPNGDFYGTVTVDVYVSDGIEESDAVELTINFEAVNDVPNIISTTIDYDLEGGIQKEIFISDFSVEDVDNAFPDDFSIMIGTGENYKLDGNIVTADSDYTGLLTIPVTVNDGIDDSPTFELTLETAPKITVLDIGDFQFSIFPSPVLDQLEIQISSYPAHEAQLEVFDFTGKMLLKKRIVVIADKAKLSVELGHFDRGMYILNIESIHYKVKTKVFKE